MRGFDVVVQFIFHSVIHFFVNKEGRSFEGGSCDVTRSQLNVLRDCLSNIPVQGCELSDSGLSDTAGLYETFVKTYPISEYSDWEGGIEEQRRTKGAVLSNDDCLRYQPTSGSTSKIKWIPYSALYLTQLDKAISPWASDMYSRFPRIKQGKHYWSLSWVPTDLRGSETESVNNDLELLSYWKRVFMKVTMAVPESTSLAKTSEESLFSTACYLVSCRSLSLISVWSPTFLMSVLTTIKKYRDEIVVVLGRGEWPSEFSGLSHVPAPKCRRSALKLETWDLQIDSFFTISIWPNLALISAWDTSSSSAWAKRVKGLFPHASFQGKGLWSTEGVVTIPYAEAYTLAFNSHFYEFEELKSNQVFPSWKLKKGMRVRPVITFGNGIIRYRMNDQLVVSGFFNKVPCFDFEGRLEGVDLVGEKLSQEAAKQVFNVIDIDDGLLPVSLLALPATVNRPVAGYILLAEKINNNNFNQELISKKIERALQDHFHYKLARDLTQLLHAEVLIVDDAISFYEKIKMIKGMSQGDIKVECLSKLSEKEADSVRQGYSYVSSV